MHKAVPSSIIGRKCLFRSRKSRRHSGFFHVENDAISSSFKRTLIPAFPPVLPLSKPQVVYENQA
jgi:hypothetical protein